MCDSPTTLCAVPQYVLNVTSYEKAQRLPFELSKLASRHKDVRDMFAAFPELISPVNNVLKRYGSVSIPCIDNNSTDYWRKVAKYFIDDVMNLAKETDRLKDLKVNNDDGEICNENSNNETTNVEEPLENGEESTDDSNELDPYQPFYVVDLGRIIIQMAKFRKFLPQVQPFYAMKSNPNKAVIEMIAALGGSFDCASRAEMRIIKQGEYVTSAYREDYCFNKFFKLREGTHDGSSYDDGSTTSMLKEATRDDSSFESIEMNDMSRKALLNEAALADEASSTNDGSSVNEVPLLGTEHGIIFSNPCKSISCMRYADKINVRYVTFDNSLELLKLAKHMPNAKAIIRLKTKDSNAVCPFSTKFGASMEEARGLLVEAMQKRVSVVGVSFHVGSGNGDIEAYKTAVMDAKKLFDVGEQLGFDMKILDLGGGWPGTDLSESTEVVLSEGGKDGKKKVDDDAVNTMAAEELAVFNRKSQLQQESSIGMCNDGVGKSVKRCDEVTFEDIANEVMPLLEKYFSTAHIIAEPGRFFSASTHMLAVNVHSKRKVPLEAKFKLRNNSCALNGNLNDTQVKMSTNTEPSLEHVSYSGNSSIHNNNTVMGAEPFDFSTSLINDNNYEYQYYINDGLYNSFNCILFDHAHPELHLVKPNSNNLNISTIFGPTCDSLDCILKQKPFPELEIGDWLFVPDFGSYTTAAGTPFNGFDTKKIIYINSVASVEE